MSVGEPGTPTVFRRANVVLWRAQRKIEQSLDRGGINGLLEKSGCAYSLDFRPQGSSRECRNENDRNCVPEAEEAVVHFDSRQARHLYIRNQE
ncbi:hypothetical protein P3T40_004713 [Paraburkholderia sp. EB58]